MNEKVQIERDMRRQDEIEEVVGIEGQRVRISGERLSASIEKVPVRNLAGAKDPRRHHLDRIVGREVVAKEKEAEPGDDDAAGNNGNQGENANALSPQSS